MVAGNSPHNSEEEYRNRKMVQQFEEVIAKGIRAKQMVEKVIQKILDRTIVVGSKLIRPFAGESPSWKAKDFGDEGEISHQRILKDLRGVVMDEPTGKGV